MTDITLTVQSSFSVFSLEKKKKVSGSVRIFPLAIEKLWPGLASELHDTKNAKHTFCRLRNYQIE